MSGLKWLFKNKHLLENSAVNEKLGLLENLKFKFKIFKKNLMFRKTQINHMFSSKLYMILV